METYKQPIYDAVFVPCKEPSLETRAFPEHHLRAVECALALWITGEASCVVPLGGHAARYDAIGEEPAWFGTECDWTIQHFVDMGYPASAFRREKRSRKTGENFKFAVEDVIDPSNDPTHPSYSEYPGPIADVLVVTADERMPRIQLWAELVLAGIVRKLDFKSSGPVNDPELTLKELFAYYMQSRHLNIPAGRAGHEKLDATSGEGDLRLFWRRYDEAAHRLPPASQGTTIAQIVAHMDTTDIDLDIMESARKAAKELAPVAA